MVWYSPKNILQCRHGIQGLFLAYLEICTTIILASSLMLIVSYYSSKNILGYLEILLCIMVVLIMFIVSPRHTSTKPRMSYVTQNMHKLLQFDTLKVQMYKKHFSIFYSYPHSFLRKDDFNFLS